MTLEEKYTDELDRHAAVEWQRCQREDDYWHETVVQRGERTRRVTMEMLSGAIHLLERKALATKNYESVESSSDRLFWHTRYWESERELRQYPDEMLQQVKAELMRRKYYRLLSWVLEYYGNGETFSSCHHGARTT